MKKCCASVFSDVKYDSNSSIFIYTHNTRMNANMCGLVFKKVSYLLKNRVHSVIAHGRIRFIRAYIRHEKVSF